MNKKIIISIISLIIIFIVFFGIWKFAKTKEEEKNTDIVENTIELSYMVADDCLNEWNDYNETNSKETISQVQKDDKHYLLRSVNGYINIYYLNVKEQTETLYKETDIAVNYLSPEDMDDLEMGIEVVGNEELNKILEDFE